MKTLLRPVVAIVLCVSLIGCPAQSNIAALALVLGNAVANIAALQNNPSLSAKITADTAAAVATINNWKSGTPASEVIEALNLVEDDINLIPSTGPYVPLIDLSIATIESILALLPQPATAKARTVTVSPLVTPATTPKDLKKKWNALAPDEASKIK
jgi:hypothetical protein